MRVGYSKSGQWDAIRGRGIRGLYLRTGDPEMGCEDESFAL